MILTNPRTLLEQMYVFRIEIYSKSEEHNYSKFEKKSMRIFDLANLKKARIQSKLEDKLEQDSVEGKQ